MDRNNNKHNLSSDGDQFAGHSYNQENEHAPDSLLPSLLARLGLGNAPLSIGASIESLVAALKDQQWQVRAASARILGELGDKAAIEPLAAALDDESIAVRASTARALGKFKEQAPVEPLVAALGDRAWQVRAAAARALGELGASVPGDALIASLYDEDSSARAAAAHALGLLSDPSSLDPLLTAFSDDEWHVRETAILALGDKAPLEPLMPILNDENEFVREAAQIVLQQTHPEASFTSSTRTMISKEATPITASGLQEQDPTSTEIEFTPLSSGELDESSTILTRLFNSAKRLFVIQQRPRSEIAQDLSFDNTRQYPVRAKAHFFTHLSEGIIAALIVASIVVGWLAISQKLHPTSTSQHTIPTGTILFTYHGQDKGYYPVWSLDSKHMAFVSVTGVNGGGKVYVWDAGTGKLTNTFTMPLLPSNTVTEWTWAPDGVHLMFASEEGMLQVWNALTGRKIFTYDSHAGVFPTFGWSYDGQRIALNNGKDGIVEIWDTVTGNKLLTYHGSLQNIYDLEWCPDGTTIASLSRSRIIQVWDVKAGKELLNLSNPSLEYVVWSLDGKRLLAVSDDRINNDKSVRVWDIITGRKLLTYTGNTRSPFTAQWSADGTRIITADVNETQIWDSYTGRTILTLHIPSDAWRLSPVSPDGSYLAFSNGDNRVQIWDIVTGSKILTYQGHSGYIQGVVWSGTWSSQGGRDIASASDDKIVQVWDAITGKGIYTYHVASNSIQTMVWSPDGKLIAVAGQDNILQVLKV